MTTDRKGRPRPHYRPLAKPECDKCRELATDEIWQDGLVGLFCPRHGSETFQVLLREWQRREGAT